MLKAARAQGKPMIVMTMMTAAMAQPTAIHRPPNRIQSRLRRSDRTDMRASRNGRQDRPIGPYVVTTSAVCQAGLWPWPPRFAGRCRKGQQALRLPLAAAELNPAGRALILRDPPKNG